MDAKSESQQIDLTKWIYELLTDPGWGLKLITPSAPAAAQSGGVREPDLAKLSPVVWYGASRIQ
jgi:hypothetical protein